MLGAGPRKVVHPAGSTLSTMLSPAMMVAGIGLATEGLLLAAAGFVLAIIDWNRYTAANPWAFPSAKDDPEAAAAAFSGEVTRISLANAGVVFGLSAAALVAVQQGGDDLYALPPAALAALITLWQSNRLTAVLERRG